jgi:hypothetical protein
MIAHGVGLYLLTYADSLLMVGGFAMLHGIAWGIRGPLMVAIRADYFGPKSFGTITGISSMIVMMGMMSVRSFAEFWWTFSTTTKSRFPPLPSPP